MEVKSFHGSQHSLNMLTSFSAFPYIPPVLRVKHPFIRLFKVVCPCVSARLISSLSVLGLIPWKPSPGVGAETDQLLPAYRHRSRLPL